MASGRSATWSLRKIAETWLATVLEATPSRWPIAALFSPAGQQVQDVALALRELGKRHRRSASRRRLQRGEHSLCHAVPEDRLPGRDRGDGAGDVLLLDPLDEIPASPGPHGGEDRLVVVAHRQHQDRHRRRDPGELTGRGDPVELGHVQVEQSDVGLRGDDLTHCRPTVSRDRNHLEVRQGSQQGSQAGPHDRVVVGHHDADAHPAPSGIDRKTRPPDVVGPASKRAPTSAARSRIALSPTPGVQAVATSPSSRTDTSSEPLQLISMTAPCAPACRVTLSRASVATR